MNSPTKIVVIPMKRLILCAVAIGIGILLLIIAILTLNKDSIAEATSKLTSIQTHQDLHTNASVSSTYVPGVYTSSLTLNGTPIDIEVTVDENHINDIQMVHLSDSVTTMYPMLESVFSELATNVIANGSVQNISYSADNKYTSTRILNAIDEALNKCRIQ